MQASTQSACISYLLFLQDVFLSTQVSLQLISQLIPNKTTNRFQVMQQSHLQIIHVEVKDKFFFFY